MSTSSKKVLTLSDLKTALSPLVDAIESLKNDTTTATAQILEIHQVCTNLSVKLDNLDQSIDTTTPAKKKRPPPKKPARVPTKKNSAIDDVVASDDDDDATAKADDADDADNTDAEESDSSVRKPVKKVPSRKTSAKKPAPVKRNPNKMDYFKKKFDEDPSYFDDYLNETVKADIANKHKSTWKNLSSDKLHVAHRKAYYEYMKNNHDDQLQAGKSAYIQDIERASTVIEEKED